MRHADPYNEGQRVIPGLKPFIRPQVDRTVNDDIQENGAHFGGRAPEGTAFDPSEYAWYKRHKDYSKKDMVCQ